MIEHILDILSNDNYGNISNFIIWLNVFAASYAFYWNVKAASTALTTGRKALFSRNSAITLLFLIGYCVLLLDVDPFRWAQIMQGVSLMAWVFVWAGPAREDYKQDKLISDEVEKEIVNRMKLNFQKDNQ